MQAHCEKSLSFVDDVSFFVIKMINDNDIAQLQSPGMGKTEIWV